MCDRGGEGGEGERRGADAFFDKAQVGREPSATLTGPDSPDPNEGLQNPEAISEYQKL